MVTHGASQAKSHRPLGAYFQGCGRLVSEFRVWNSQFVWIPCTQAGRPVMEGASYQNRLLALAMLLSLPLPLPLRLPH